MAESNSRKESIFKKRLETPAAEAFMNPKVFSDWLRLTDFNTYRFSKVINKHRKTIIKWCKTGVPSRSIKEVHAIFNNHITSKGISRIYIKNPEIYKNIREDYIRKRKSPFRYYEPQESESEEPGQPDLLDHKISEFLDRWREEAEYPK